MSTTDVHEMSDDAIASEVFDLLGYRVVKYWLADVITPRWAYKVVTPEGVCHWMTAHQNAENAKREVCNTWISDTGAAFELCCEIVRPLEEEVSVLVSPLGEPLLYTAQMIDYKCSDGYYPRVFTRGCKTLSRALSELALLSLREMGEGDE